SHSNRLAGRSKSEKGGTANNELPIRGVVIHIALTGMRLTPGVFLWRVVLRFSIVSSACVLRRVQVALFDKNAMGGRGVSMSGVVSSRRWKSTGKRIHPGARPHQAVLSIFLCEIRVRTAHAEMRVIRVWYAAETTVVILVCAEGVLHPGFTDLFEAIIIVRAAAHPIEVFADN